MSLTRATLHSALGLLLAAAMLLACALPGWTYSESSDPRDNAIEYARLGNAQMRLGRFDQAAAFYRSAIKLNPYSGMSASLYNNLGQAYRQMGEYPLAVASFQHAVRIRPDYELYYKNLIETYADARLLADAEAALSRILQDNPDNAEALYLLALTLEEQGRKDAAKAHFQRYIQLKPYANMVLAAKKHL